MAPSHDGPRHAIAPHSRPVRSPDAEPTLSSSGEEHIALPALVQALVVAEQLNFQRVAEILGISQSMISSRRIVLEDALGVTLFESRRFQFLRLILHGRAFLDLIALALLQIGRAVRATDL